MVSPTVQQIAQQNDAFRQGDTQQWVLHSCYDEYRCETCDAESKRVDWLV